MYVYVTAMMMMSTVTEMVVVVLVVKMNRTERAGVKKKPMLFRN